MSVSNDLRRHLRALARAYDKALALMHEDPVAEEIRLDLMSLQQAIGRLALVGEGPPRPRRDRRGRGMNAMQAALAWKAAETAGTVPRGPRKHYAHDYGITPVAVGEARSVMRHAPDLVSEVLTGEVFLGDAFWDAYFRREKGYAPRVWLQRNWTRP